MTPFDFNDCMVVTASGTIYANEDDYFDGYDPFDNEQKIIGRVQ